MLDKQLIEQLKQYFERLEKDVELVLHPGDNEKRQELKIMLQDVASASDRVTMIEAGTDAVSSGSDSLTAMD